MQMQTRGSGLIDGPRHLEHFVWNMSRDLHERSFARECSSRKGNFIKNSFRALCTPQIVSQGLSRHHNVSTSMFHFRNVVQFRLDYFRYVWDSEKTFDRCQHLETFRPFKVSRTFSADWLSVRNGWINNTVMKQILQLVLNLSTLKLY